MKTTSFQVYAQISDQRDFIQICGMFSPEPRNISLKQKEKPVIWSREDAFSRLTVQLLTLCARSSTRSGGISVGVWLSCAIA